MPEIITTYIETAKGRVEFTLDKMPVDEQFYAAYCYYDGKRYCFHLMYDNESLEFKVIDNRNCPEEIQELVYLISRAIEQYHV